MSSKDVSVALVPGAWADGSSWANVIRPLAADGINVVAAPLPLSLYRDDVAALDRTLARVTGPVVLAGHAYAGAVIGAVPYRNRRECYIRNEWTPLLPWDRTFKSVAKGQKKT